MSAPAASPRVSLAFLIVAFGVAIVIGAVIAYLGISGRIGAGIP